MNDAKKIEGGDGGNAWAWLSDEMYVVVVVFNGAMKMIPIVVVFSFFLLGFEFDREKW